jgi:hypothetical protein
MEQPCGMHNPEQSRNLEKRDTEKISKNGNAERTTQLVRNKYRY